MLASIAITLNNLKSAEAIQKIADKKRGTCWYNDGSVEIMIKPDGSIPEGFVKGRIKGIK